MSSVSMSVEDTVVLAKRNLMRIPRQPDLLIAYTVQPVMFVLLFVYVFGGAIQTPGFDYVDFLMPGIIVQSIAFGGFVTALGLSEDVKKGLIDRFRSLPMSRAAVLTARTSSDIVLNCLSLAVLLAVGFAAGFNFIDATAGEIILGIVLCLYLGYAFSWIFALIGLYSSTPETANSIGFTLIFPLTFASSVFVPAASMPDGLRQFAEANPFTTISDAVRSLWLNTPANTDIWMSFIWCTVLTVVFAPLAVKRYRTVARNKVSPAKAVASSCLRRRYDGIEAATTRIIEAMRRSVAARGAAGATFDHVAREAGVSRGLLHYHFGTKERLLAEVVRRDTDIRMAALDRALAEAHTADEVIEVLVHSLEDLVDKDPGLVALVFELFTSGRRNPEIAVEFAALQRATRARLAELLTARQEQGAVRLADEPEAVAAVLLSLADGLALRLLGEPEHDHGPSLRAATTAARTLLTR